MSFATAEELFRNAREVRLHNAELRLLIPRTWTWVAYRWAGKD